MVQTSRCRNLEAGLLPACETAGDLEWRELFSGENAKENTENT
jgi:hypothetical protein